MAEHTEIEIQIDVKNGGCNIAKGMYPLNTPLHIELTPNKLYGYGAGREARLYYCYKATGISSYSEKFKKSATSDVWVLDTELSYYYAANDDMYCVVQYEYERKYAEIKNNLTRCSTDKPDGTYPFTSQTITLTADKDCEFHVTPKISYYAYDETSIPWEWRYWDYDFERISESEYRYTFTPNKDNTVYTVSAEAVAKTDITDKYGLIAAYKPNKDILAQLSKVRFATPKLNSVKVDNAVLYVTTQEYIDTADYMVSLKKFYFHIDTEIQENICLGPYNTEIECPVIGTDIITLNMGTIAITGKYNNIMDYKNTEIQMYLPFIGFIDLRPSDFMEKTITLKYEMNIINGDGLAVIYADNEVMITQQCNAAFNIPYRLNDRETVNNDLQSNTNYMLCEKPFIYVKSYNPAIPDGTLPYNDTKYYSQFDKVHGYTQATEIDFEVVHEHITRTEIDEIISCIESGVFLP